MTGLDREAWQPRTTKVVLKAVARPAKSSASDY